MFENTTRLQATDPIFCTVWKHNTMFENTTKLQATGKIWLIEATEYVAMLGHIWSYTKFTTNGVTFKVLRPPNMWHCLEVPHHQICGNVCKYLKIAGHEGTLKLLKHTQYLAISEDTPSLPPTVEYLNHWSHQICDYVWEYHKIAGHGVKFELLKPPNILQPPNIWRYLKIQQDCQKRIKLLIVWSHQISGNVWKYHRIGGHGAEI